MPTLHLGPEPVAVISAVVAVLTALETAAITMPVWAHTALTVALVVLGAVLSRCAVTPAPKTPPAAPTPPTAPTVTP